MSRDADGEIEGMPVGTILHTSEAASSRERAEEEIEEADPERERAIAVLMGEGGIGDE